MKQKGFAAVGALIGLLVFLLLIFVAILPILATNINAVSATNVLLPNGHSTNSLLIIIPLLVVLGAVATIAYGMLSG